MNYLYHGVPRDMRGDTLYPLNTLRGRLPDVYEMQVKKYVGREHVLENRIPVLDDCLWNDVLFTMATHPQDLADARREAGWPDRDWKFYRIDPTRLDQSKLGVFLFTPGAKESGRFNEDFAPYRYEDLARHALIPQATKDYFKSEHDAGEPFIHLLFRYIPHVLYQGEIKVSDYEIINLR